MHARTRRETLSARGVSREFQIALATVLRAIHEGDLRAVRLGSTRFLILRRDVYAWLDRYALHPDAHAQIRQQAQLRRAGPLE